MNSSEAERWRKIIHVDMDAFFASVEQRDDPQLRGRPVAVGSAGPRGVVAAASYEARAYGVHSAMASSSALRLCPGLVFARPRFEVYKSVSNQIREIFHQYTDLVEPLSLDEAYLDVTHNKAGIVSAIQIAKEIKGKIFEQTGLTASAGVSINKFLAKSASGMNKPNGLTFIPPEKALDFIAALPIEKFHGIGKVTAEHMKAWGVFKGADLQARSELELIRKWGKAGRHYYKIAHALDNRPVEPYRERKSLSAEDTFEKDVCTEAEMRPFLETLCSRVAAQLAKHDIAARTITLKIKYSDFTLRSRSRTPGYRIRSYEQLLALALLLLYEPEFPPQAVRLLGVGVSNFDRPPAPGQPVQLSFDF